MPELIIRIILIVAPMYFANATALLFGGKIPLDMGKFFVDGKRIFGEGKTVEGTVAGIVFGIITTLLIHNYFVAETAFVGNYFLYGILVTVGAVVGDILASFVKRRVGRDRGTNLPLLDQLDFVIGGLILGSLVFIPESYDIVLLLILTFFMHSLTNRLAFALKIKNVPW